ncbi:hypothetical protein ACFTZI_13580 [Streptomyces decoyicus]|uniref:hypothetical protein n=1 Tax=Streptomyces decoyicus TaxID=249567 RepID=UPI0036397B8B
MQVIKLAGKVAAAAAIAAVLAGASPAFADAGEDITSTFSAEGGEKVSYAYSLQKYGNKNVAIQDKREDKAPVYAEFDRLKTKGLRVWNNSDVAGSTKYSDSSASNYVVKVTACWQQDAVPDSCGPDDRPGDGR